MGSSGDDAVTVQGSAAEPVSQHQLPWARILVSVLGVLVAMLLAALDQTIVATALPSMVADLGGFEEFAWVFTAYMLGATTVIPIMGKLSDMYGRKWVLAGGVVVFMVGSALSGISQDMLQLILSRGIQGLGAGSIIANSYSVVADFLPPAKRGQWMGVIGTVSILAVVMGPLAGGYVTDHLTWRWIFFVNLPVGFVALAVILGGLSNVRNSEVKPSIDYRGIVTLVACAVPLLLALTWAGNEFAWFSPQILGLLLFSGLMAAIFLLAERRAEEPLIPSFLFTSPIFVVGVAVTFLTAVVTYGGVMFVPLFVQGVVGSSATNAGFVLMPAMLAGVASAIVAGQIISRTGHYRVLAIGAACILAAAVYLLTLLDTSSSSAHAIRFAVVAGAGVGAIVPTIIIAVQNAFPHHMLGVVTSSIQFFRSIGGALGTAVLGSFMTMRLGNWLSNSLSQEAVDAMPATAVERLRDPQALMNPGAMDQIRELAGEGEGGAEALAVVVEGLRTALAAAMHDVFLLGLGIAVVAAVITLFLREIPLRETIAEPARKADVGSTDERYL